MVFPHYRQEVKFGDVTSQSMWHKPLYLCLGSAKLYIIIYSCKSFSIICEALS